MIGVKKNVIVFFGIFLIGMLFVPPGIPFMVPEAEAEPHTATAQTPEEEACLTLANLGRAEIWRTVVTCEIPFNVTVHMGQRLHIQNPNGGSHNMLPAAEFGTGGGQYTVPDGWASGTIDSQGWSNIPVSVQSWGFNISGSNVDFEKSLPAQ